MRILAAILSLSVIAFSGEVDSTPKLILTPKLLKRLRRDRDRQTQRWLNFEARVKSVADSPERGFELALYYQVAQDAASCQAAVAWARRHSTEIRQIAFIRDWCSSVLTPDESTALTPSPATLAIKKPTFAALENLLLTSTAFGSEPKIDDNAWNALLKQLKLEGPASLSDDELYSFSEFLDAAKTATGQDLRRPEPAFFSQLPAEILLSLRPERVESPGSKLHAAALALVTLDPNLDSAQFLQGWGLEENQTIRDGPGVAYEFLWADPYLPGVSYQNLEPWIYDPAGRLFARSDWSPNACWLALSAGKPQQVNCPAGWDNQTTHFGHLTLIPMTTRCVEIAQHGVSETTVLWRLQPGEALFHQELKRKITNQADSAGLLRVSAEIEGQLCGAQR